jgi:Tol biopolymer transport system component
VALAVIAVAAAAAGAVVLLRSGDEENGKHASVSPTPTASASVSATASASPSPSPSDSPTPATGFPMAITGGPKSTILSLLSAEGEVTQLGDPLGDWVYQVSWSPDGRRLACVAGAWDKARLWVADVDAGSLAEVVVTAPAVVSVDSVAWLSPSELLVAGFTVRPKAQGEVAEFVVYDIESSSVVGPLLNGAGTSLRGVSVSSSADGNRVAYVTYTDQKTDAYGMPTATERLELLDRAAGSVAELGTGKAYFDVNARRFDDPLIAPDGQAVIYRAAGGDVGTSYTVVDANGSVIMQSKDLTFPAGYAWDPTGQKVVFTGHSIKGTGGENDPVVFYVFDRALGGRPQTIAKYKGTMVQDVSWSPDGASIAFAEYDRDDYDTGNVYQLAATGGDADRLVSGALNPAYRPATPGP